MKVHYQLTEKSLVVAFDGQHYNLSKSDHRFKGIVQAIKEGRFDDIPDLVQNESFFKKFEGLTLKDGQLFYHDKELPSSLSERVIKFAEEGFPFEPLIMFFEKLSKNPSFNSRQMLFKFLEHNGHPITQDGNFIAYRGVTRDFKDCHTETFDNSPGSVCSLPRDQVDDNPNNTCSNGLHVACHDYAHGFGRVTVEVEVNPENVVCVPEDYHGTKMRVSEFTVLSVCENERTDDLYGYEEDEEENLEWDHDVPDFPTE